MIPVLFSTFRIDKQPPRDHRLLRIPNTIPTGAGGLSSRRSQQGKPRLKTKIPTQPGGRVGIFFGENQVAAYLAICLSFISSSVLQSMHRVAVGRASRRLMPISTPHLTQNP